MSNLLGASYELPDLEAIREFLPLRLTGVTIASVEVRQPLVVRNLFGGKLDDLLIGRRLASPRSARSWRRAFLDETMAISDMAKTPFAMRSKIMTRASQSTSNPFPSQALRCKKRVSQVSSILTHREHM
jgi:hypothetical protein